MNRSLRRAAAGLALAVAVGVIAPVGTAHAVGPWQGAVQLPGTAALNVGGSAAVNSESCASTGNCTVGGKYKDASAHVQAYVADLVGGVWHNAVEVPGTAALNAGGNATVTSVSCASAGNCAAAGFYTDASGHAQAFVANEANGTWQSAVEVPGTAALNAGGSAAATSVSCPSPGSCTVGGRYREADGYQQAFVANQINGAWHPAVELPGLAALNVGGWANVTSVSCGFAGSCGVGGIYTDASGHGQAFVDGETVTVWQSAVELPGTAALNVGGSAAVQSLSCASAGNCSAGGSYYDASRYGQVFVANEVGGTWQNAAEVPATATLNAGGFANVSSVDCASAGNCAAGGSYYDASGKQQAFVVSEAGGAWQAAVEVPGTASLNAGGYAEVASVSCNTAGNCTAGGGYEDASYDGQAFVVNEANGVWQYAAEVSGTAALNADGSAAVGAVSCASDGFCGAGGYYLDAVGRQQVFAVGTPAGVWQNAKAMPGVSALNVHGSEGISALSCPSAGYCAVGGFYEDANAREQAFVATESNGVWQNAVEVPGTAALNAGGMAGVDSVSCGSAGWCSAVGFYTDAAAKVHAFAADMAFGVWQNAVEIPGTAALDVGGVASGDSVSCASAGNCTALGRYRDASGHRQAFVASSVGGVWQSAVKLPGLAALNAGGYVDWLKVSCRAAGSCSAAGTYFDASLNSQAFVAGATNQVWQSAVEAPGSGALNAGGNATVESVSCGAPGTCSVTGEYFDASKQNHALLVNEVNGVWQNAVQAPGTAALSATDSEGRSVSCTSAGECGAAGTYWDASGYGQVYVADEVNGTWRNAVQAPGFAALNTPGRVTPPTLSCASPGNCALGGSYESGGDYLPFVANEVNGVWQNAVPLPGFAALGADGYSFVRAVSCGAAGNCTVAGDYTSGTAVQAFVDNSA